MAETRHDKGNLMARIRTVKPEFSRHEKLFDAESQTALPLRLAFIALWTVADREGRFKWRPRTLKVECLPYDDCDFSLVLDALATYGFVIRYEVEGEQYGFIPSFPTHQTVNNREAQSCLPPPNEINYLTREQHVSDASGTRLVQEQGEGKGKEGKEIDDASLTHPSGPLIDSSKEKRSTPQKRLETVLRPEIARAVVDHRQRLRKQLTEHAAGLLAASLAKAKDPNAAAERMIEKGWASFDPSWGLAQSVRPNAANRRAGPWGPDIESSPG
jgi:hypothetical protein